jgi:uncharacterized membrane protein
MKKNSVRWAGVCILALAMAVALWPYFARAAQPDLGLSTLGSETLRARVTGIVEEGEIDLGGRMQHYQVAQVELLEGEYPGLEMQIDYGKRQVRADDYRLRPGDLVIVSVSRTPENVLNAYFVDFVRAGPLLLLTAIFAGSILLISRWKGLRSLLSLAFSLFVIIAYIIPHILAGEDPVAVSLMGSIVLLGVTLYLTYGWTLKTHAAVISMAMVLLLTGLLAALFVTITRLNGTGDENVMFLMQELQTPINLRGLLLGGMIIGALGVLDDLVMTQASAVLELRAANRDLGFRGLFQAAMRIGQDHVSATVNTLVLAYAGASLPLFLMFSLARGDYTYLVNFSFIAEEIVRTLVGSVGLVAAVPLSTAVSAALVLRDDRAALRAG